MFKRTVSVISSDPPCKNGNLLFTTIPLEPVSDNKCGRYRRFPDSKSDYFCELLLASILNKRKPFHREPANENKQLNETKTWISISRIPL